MCVMYQFARIIPQQQAWIVERFGRFYETKVAGLNFFIPFVDKIVCLCVIYIQLFYL